MRNVSVRLPVLLLALVAVCHAGGTLRAQEEGALRVATFDMDVTPPVGSHMAYDPVKGTWDLGLRARGIVLLGAGEPVVLCAIDWIGIANGAYDTFRREIALAAETRPARVALHALHQHDAPVCDFSSERILRESGVEPLALDGSFAREVIPRLKDAVASSLEDARPVTHLGLGSAEVYKVASNRRILGEDGKVRAMRFTSCRDPDLRAEPEGTIDPVVSLVSLWNGDAPLAVLSYYAVHPQSYYRTGLPNPDFPGVARFLRQMAVPEALHVHFTGAAGNLGAGKYNDGSPENRMVLAERLADGMRRAWESTERSPLGAGDISWKTESVTLPPARNLSRAKAEAALKGEAGGGKAGAARQLAWLRRCESGESNDVTCLALGRARILHLPGELFVEYQLAAKAARPDLFVAMAAYGDYGPGYIGTADAYGQGGYETGAGTSKVAPEVEGVLLGAIRRLLDASPTSGRGPTPRLIILADMGNEPDEEQQMTHMLVHSNEFELEGLIAVTGKFLNESSRNEYKRVVHPELFHKLIEGYAKVVDNLRLHAGGWPTPEHLHGIVQPGQRKYGLADTGEGKSSEGSRLIARSLEKDDPRPLNVVVNAGSNTLAQALRDLRAAHTPEECEAMVRKLRVFENGAQDNCGAWICREFPFIHWIRSNHQTYGYMGQAPSGGEAAGPWCWKPHPRTHQGQHRWAETHILRGHGALGELYPYRFGGNGFLEGGGTIPWIGLVNKGLYDIDHPSWGGWSGRFTATKQKNVWSRHASVRKDEEGYGDFFVHTEAPDRWTDPSDGTVYENDFAPVWRWRQAMLNNCRARFDWCVKPYDEANHHPLAAVDGDATDSIVRRQLEAGTTLAVDSAKSTDPDGDRLHRRWYFYPEAGTYRGRLPELDGADSERCSFKAPKEAAGKQLHLILEVTDDSDIVPLTDYRRVVVDVTVTGRGP